MNGKKITFCVIIKHFHLKKALNMSNNLICETDFCSLKKKILHIKVKVKLARMHECYYVGKENSSIYEFVM